MAKKRQIILLAGIFLLALFLRLFQLGSLPGGFHVDEVKVGWNAFSMLITGKDDWGKIFPIHYNTFGDFRPTGIIYSTIPSVALFGLTEFAVRFTPAIFGAMSVLMLYLVVYEVSRNKNLAALSSAFMAISPWHIALSRATSEAVISVTLTLVGTVLFIRGCKKKNLSLYLLSLLFLVISYFFYHIFRFLTPLLLTVIYLNYFRFSLNWKPLAVLITSAVISLGFLFSTQAKGRFSQVSIFNDQQIKYELQKLPFEEGNNKVFTARAFHNKLVLYTSRFITEYTRYFSPEFLIGAWVSKPSRYVTVGMGPLTYMEFLLFVFGFVYFVRKPRYKIFLALMLISPVTAALTTEDVPNLSRALFENPMICIFTAMGALYLRSMFPRFKKLVYILVVINSIYFLHMYTIHNIRREEISMSRNAGVKELISLLPQLQKKYAQVVLTNIPDSLYPWYAFYLRPDVLKFNSLAASRDSGAWQYQNVIFSQFKCPTGYQEQFSHQAVFVDTEGCPENTQLETISRIYRSSDGLAYRVYLKR